MAGGQSYANVVFFRIGVIAYDLFIGFKRLSYRESWMGETIATFWWEMVQMAGRIVTHVGKSVLRLMIDLEMLEVLKGIRQKCFEWLVTSIFSISEFGRWSFLDTELLFPYTKFTPRRVLISDCFLISYVSKNDKEGFLAFTEKRNPIFKGRWV